MLNILFFASVKEQLGCASLEMQCPVEGTDLDTVQEQLCAEHGDSWRETLSQENLIRAVNQVIAEGNCTLNDGDEVAFFPPVTGG